MAAARADDGRVWDGDVEEDYGTVSPLQGEEDFNKSCEKQMALLELMDKTGYNMLQVNGQRMYGGPPPGWEGPPPPRDCEVFVGKIPRDMYEDELVPLLARAGKIYEFRLMMEFNGSNRGYAFVMYTNREDAHNAIQIFNNHEVRPGRFIGVCLSLNNCRLFIGCIPKDKAKEEIMEELRTVLTQEVCVQLKKVTDGVVDVVAYHRSTDQNTNRGFAFIEYETHKAAAMARRTLIAGNRQLWGHTIQVDWAKPERDMDEAIMQRVRVLYVCSLRPSTTEETLLQEFSSFKPGCVERVKKISDYAFIHYRCREDAIAALGLMNGAIIDGVSVEVTLSRPAVTRDGRRHNSWGYPESRGGEASSRTVLPPRSRRGTGDAPGGASPLRAPPLPTHPGSPACATARDDPDRCVLPLLPSTPLCPGSLQVLEPGQIRSAVSLLDFYCSKNYWSQPQYQLFTTARWDGKLLLLYKVVIPCTQSTYVPDKLCALLEDAKELAAQTALWNLDPSFLSEVSYNAPGSLPPPLGIPLPSSTLLTCSSRAFTSCISPPAPPPSPSPFSHSALSLSMLAPPDPQTQRVYLSSESPFY